MVWDTIIARDTGLSEPVQEWGGIAYALSAFEAVRPAGWTMLPIIKVAPISESAPAASSPRCPASDRWKASGRSRNPTTGSRCATRTAVAEPKS